MSYRKSHYLDRKIYRIISSQPPSVVMNHSHFIHSCNIPHFCVFMLRNQASIHCVFLLPRTRAIQVHNLLPDEEESFLLFPVPLILSVVSGVATTAEGAPDLLDALLALEVLLDGDSRFVVFFHNVVDGLAATEGLAARVGPAVKLDVRAVLMPDPVVAAALSEPFEKRTPGVLMSCFEMREVSDASLETLRRLATGTVSARGLLRIGTENFFLRTFTDCEGPSSSVSESKAEISSGCLRNGGRSG